MTWGEFDASENKAVPSTQDVDPSHEIQEGDLLLSRANTCEYVGATVLVGPCRPGLLLSDKSMRLLARDGVDRRWLRYALASPQVRERMSQLATGTSDSMRNISQAKVRSLTVRLPSGDRQAALADEIDELQTRRRLLDLGIRRAQARAQGLRRSILAAAFSGQLVPQDPDDEPTSVLLERIRTERAAAPPVKRARRSAAAK
jgi:type I restriction enzyme S subunit